MNDAKHALYHSLPPPPDRPRESLADFLARGGQVQRVDAARAKGADSPWSNHSDSPVWHDGCSSSWGRGARVGL